MPMLTDSREYRKINMSAIEVRSNDDDNGEMIVEGYATTFDEPYTLYDDKSFRLDEQVDPHAFDECDMSDVIMQYDHQGRVFARTNNDTLVLEPDEHGLKITANLGGTEMGRQLFAEIKGGYTNKMSFGFVVTGEKRNTTKEDDKDIVLRTITKIGKLYDVSAVSLPANDATEITARQLGEGVIKELEQERLAIAARQRMKQKIAIKAKLL